MSIVSQCNSKLFIVIFNAIFYESVVNIGIIVYL